MGHKQLVLLRGINLGAVNKVPMPALRTELDAAGLGGGGGVRTYLQSGNVMVQCNLPTDELAALLHGIVLEKWGVDAPVVVRDVDELAAVVDGNPFPELAAAHPKQYQVSFLSEVIAGPGRELLARRQQMGDTVAISDDGREVYAWHPGGIHVSKLASQLSEKKLGVSAVTARNWTTVLACQGLLDARQ